jgi:hypothetical protein
VIPITIHPYTQEESSLQYSKINCQNLTIFPLTLSAVVLKQVKETPFIRCPFLFPADLGCALSKHRVRSLALLLVATIAPPRYA